MELDLKDIIGIILDKLLLIMMIIILSASATYVVSEFIIDDTYQASATMFISSNKNTNEMSALTYNDYNLNLKLVNSYRELCKTEKILSRVLEEMESELTLKELSGKIEVSSINDTEIIKITVKDTIPERTQQIANAVAAVFMSEIPEIMKMDNVQLIDEADMPESPVEPNVLMNTAIGAILGLMIGIGIAFITEYFNVTVTKPEQIEELFDIPIIATIPRIEKGRESI